jgi:hypothetical protein
MKRKLMTGLATAALVMGFAGFVRGEGADTVRIEGRLGVVGGVSEATTLSIQLFKVQRDHLGQFQLAGPAENRIVTLEPGSGGATGTFEAELEVGDVEYEVVVVPLDADGNMRSDGRYYFAGPDMTGDYPEKVVTLVPGQVNQLDMPLQWGWLSQRKQSNILQVVPRKSKGDFLMSVAVSDPTDVRIM